MLSFVLVTFAVPLFTAIRANAESHVIKFVNQCGYGSPALMFDGNNILTGDEYTSSGSFSGIAYLQTGECNTNGENCTLLETTLINPTCAGCGSSTDISLIPPHAYNVETSFAYYNGCDGAGQTCSNSTCAGSAFFVYNDNVVQVECQSENVNLLVAFCGEASQLVPSSGSSSASTGAGPTPSASSPSSSAPATLSSAAPQTSLGTSASGSISPPATAAPSAPASPTALAPPATSASPTSGKQCRARSSSTSSLQKRLPTALPARAHRRHRRSAAGFSH
ncbi:hypothetical protein HYDPIDRAFT_32565 [Hydnomerulius pinastri MD-312]|uniref:Glycopeptide n=1 Tax=Hydnomerulius pinastri MD-312 TaxID=994086 RepID=A0A0C9V439_9AGAM|nr:hypothetical protein HYDPIDRAFT_32565 [Hydnomerulius pinastri MD-312]